MSSAGSAEDERRQGVEKEAETGFKHKCDDTWKWEWDAISGAHVLQRASTQVRGRPRAGRRLPRARAAAARPRARFVRQPFS